MDWFRLICALRIPSDRPPDALTNWYGDSHSAAFTVDCAIVVGTENSPQALPAGEFRGGKFWREGSWGGVGGVHPVVPRMHWEINTPDHGLESVVVFARSGTEISIVHGLDHWGGDI